MKSILLCLFVACLPLASAQEPSPRSDQNANLQRVFKFSGLQPATHGGLSAVGLTLHFAMYNNIYGGQAFWQETQNVLPDSKGRYTVLLGETTSGGLPADLFMSGRVFWLGVQASGQSEQPRVLIDLPLAPKSDPISFNSPIDETTKRTDATERRIALLLLIPFLVGLGMAYTEVRKWWKARGQLSGAPRVDPLNSISDRPHVTQSLRTDRLGTIRRRMRRVRKAKTRIVDDRQIDDQPIDDRPIRDQPIEARPIEDQPSKAA